MIQEEKLSKVCSDFSLLNEEQQDYILGILQALVFAKVSYENRNSCEDQPTDNRSQGESVN